MLTESQKKMLTVDVLGECWHDHWKSQMLGSFCQDCLVEGKSPAGRRRTFTTAQDVEDLMKALVKKGEWGEFMRWVCYESNKHDWGVKKDNYYYYDAGFIAWLFLSTDEDGTRTFCRLCAEYYQTKEDAR